MKVWVLGASGMLGQAVCAQLQAQGHAHLGTGSAVDITDAEAVRSFAGDQGITHLLNCAAFTQVDACEEPAHALTAARVNGLGPGHLAAAAAQLGLPCLHVSTDYVFAGDGVRPYTEADPCAPLGAYGRSKWAGEHGFWAALAGAPQPGYVVRTSWLFGHGGNNFVRTMLRLFASRPEVRVVADQVGRPTSCEDLAQALLQLLLPAQAPGGTYHFANQGQTSWHRFAAAILAEGQRLGLPLQCGQVLPIDSSEYPTPARRPAFSVLSTDKIEAALGAAPAPWEAALRRYLLRELEAQAPAPALENQ